MDGITLGLMATCLMTNCHLWPTFPLDLEEPGLITGQAGFLPKSVDQCQMVTQMMSPICHAQSPANSWPQKSWFYGLPGVFRLMLTLMELPLKTETLPWTMALPMSL